MVSGAGRARPRAHLIRPREIATPRRSGLKQPAIGIQLKFIFGFAPPSSTLISFPQPIDARVSGVVR